MCAGTSARVRPGPARAVHFWRSEVFKVPESPHWLIGPRAADAWRMVGGRPTDAYRALRRSAKVVPSAPDRDPRSPVDSYQSGTPADANGCGVQRDASAESIRRGVDASLKALATDHVDLYQVLGGLQDAIRGTRHRPARGRSGGQGRPRQLRPSPPSRWAGTNAGPSRTSSTGLHLPVRRRRSHSPAERCEAREMATVWCAGGAGKRNRHRLDLFVLDRTFASRQQYEHKRRAGRT